jgi:hypothetical protein
MTNSQKEALLDELIKSGNYRIKIIRRLSPSFDLYYPQVKCWFGWLYVKEFGGSSIFSRTYYSLSQAQSAILLNYTQKNYNIDYIQN